MIWKRLLKLHDEPVIRCLPIMMQTDIKYVVVGHHFRYASLALLAGELGAHLLIDEGNHGANWNHRRAGGAAEQTCRVVVLEDDARYPFLCLPKPGGRLADPFRGRKLLSGDWFAQSQYQMQIAERLIVADKTQADYITLPRLIHGVCYSVPPQHIERVLLDGQKQACRLCRW